MAEQNRKYLQAIVKVNTDQDGRLLSVRLLELFRGTVARGVELEGAHRDEAVGEEHLIYHWTHRGACSASVSGSTDLMDRVEDPAKLNPCDACAQMDPDGAELRECPSCGRFCCSRCIAGVGVACVECEEGEDE